MDDPALWHRLQFAFTVTYHYLFPQLTMGLALLIVFLKGMGVADVQSAERTFTQPVVSVEADAGAPSKVPLSDHYGLRARLRL